MAHILLLHSALGLRPGVLDFAERLRALGHRVEAPDYYRGHVFEDESGGVAHRDAHPEYFADVQALAEPLPPGAVLAGFSLGASFAQRLAARRPSTGAAILLHAAGTPRRAWPGVPVQVHRYAHDRWIDSAEVAGLGDAVRGSGAVFEDHVTPGAGHLFTDAGMPEYDEAATARTIDRIDAFLARVLPR